MAGRCGFPIDFAVESCAIADGMRPKGTVMQLMQLNAKVQNATWRTMLSYPAERARKEGVGGVPSILTDPSVPAMRSLEPDRFLVACQT